MSSSTATSPNISPSVGPGLQLVDWAPQPQLYQHSSSLIAHEGGTLSGRSSRVMTVDDAGKRRNEELNILLVIVGLLAATVTPFIIYIQPQLIENSTDDTAALLRILLYNTNQSIFTGQPVPELPTWPGASATLLFSQFALYACLDATLLCGLYAMLIKLLTDSNALNWKNKVLDWFTRWVFIVIYLSLSGVFFGLFVALTLQVPFLQKLGG